jgi:hypothetical protein
MSPKTNVPAEEPVDYLPGVNVAKCFEVLGKGLKFGAGYDKVRVVQCVARQQHYAIERVGLCRKHSPSFQTSYFIHDCALESSWGLSAA